MTEDESVSEYNERVLEIANDSLLLGEKKPESKIIRKVLRSLQRKFDMKVIAIEEAQDITNLKLDELFGSLLTFEMTIFDRESKKGKGVAFKSAYEQKTPVNQSDNEVNPDESIALLTKQFSKMVRKFKRMNIAGPTAKPGRKDGENFTRKVECPTFLRRQKKNYYATLSDENSDDNEVDHGLNAFTTCITEINLDHIKAKTETTCTIAITNPSARSFRWTCYYCGRKGHIRPFCYRLQRDKRVQTSENCKIAFTSVQTTNDAWYFDSGCSRHMTVMETINVVVNDFESTVNQINDENDETLNIPMDNSSCPMEVPKADTLMDGTGINSEKISKKVIVDNLEFVPSAYVKKNHPSSSIIGDPSAGIITREKEKVDYLKMIADLCYTSTIKPSSVDISLKDEYWINAIQEELLKYRRNNVWTLVLKPEGANIIGTKWIFKNKIDEVECVAKNKARLMAQGYAQVEGVDFDETFAPVTGLKHLLLQNNVFFEMMKFFLR
ncbi:putative mitochondrial protein [Cucumis melo var. makuwa]|uniref:Mitochondrial protein n=1 Tax=Cucumis melo var. makuwa TaxID=1194695 RepID=A0A5A7SN60_CUCMM|nr:putative mitochondrial protein [Cucumis melo var. makuwa]TYK11624.1 putative mitochondrial protein [Cucumis melo var. makuwa]